ncbi:unnamed protein product [Sphagnum troendelagicum]|uniref:DUF1421 domain-containing protein n=1 Tax=Sphagnum troendelagicum TaxID=128251 RepID=A0ABP0TA89_9BRYO
MKKYADNLLHVLEGMSGRLSQLEFNSQRIEYTVGELKVESADNHGAAHGKLRSLENMMREVQRSVQVLRDKQEISEEQLKLAKLQLDSKMGAPVNSAAPVQAVIELQPLAPKQVETSLALALPSSGQQSDPAIYHLQQVQHQHQLQLQQQQLQTPQMSMSPTQQQVPQQQQPQLQPQTQQQNVVLMTQQQVHQQPQQLQIQAMPPRSQPEPQYQPRTLQQAPQSQPQQLAHQIPQQQANQQPQLQLQLQYQQPQQQQQQSGQPDSEHQPQQLQPPMQASHQSQLQQQQPQQSEIQYQQIQTKHQPQPQLFYNQQQSGVPSLMQQQYRNVQSEIPSYSPQPPAKYSPEQPPANLPRGYGNRPFPQPLPQIHQQSANLLTAQMYDPSCNNRGGQLALPPAYYPGQTSLPVYETYAPFGYRMPSPGANPLAPSAGTGGCPQLPTAHLVSNNNNSNSTSNMGSSSGTPVLSTNQVAINEIITKVASMGFSKDQVHTIIRKLMENRQPVDLNIVLDELMKGGGGGYR